MPAAKPREHDVVALLVDLPDYALAAGDTGAVVHVYPQGNAYEVEFLDPNGKTRVVATLEAHQLLKLNLAPAATG
jgi:hypothetical protein